MRARSAATESPSSKAKRYAREVTEGKTPACQYVRLACERFQRDLDRRDWPFTYRSERADRAVSFMQFLPHTKGKWAAKGETLALEPWQCFIECNLFGWVHRESGLRRFRESYEEVPRKNGKSIRLAARGLYLFCADNETGAEVYSGATTEKQAYEVFRPAWQMVHRTPNLRDHFGIELAGNPRNPGPLFAARDLSRFEAIIGKPGDGPSPHGALVDEYHEHDSDHMVDSLKTGMGAREQPLLSIITTAGANLGGPCYEKRRDIIRILEGQVVDESVFGIIYGLDDTDAWDDPANLRKANPNYNVSVFGDFLEAQLAQARRSASKQNAFRTKHLDQWVGARTVWMNMLSWQRQRMNLKLADFAGSPAWFAVDLASKKDVAALVILIERNGQFYCIPRFYAPELAAEENVKYRAYATSGDLVLTPGSMTDYEFIEHDLLELARQLRVEKIGFDEWQANYLITRLQNTSLKDKVVVFNQTVRNMSEPMKEVDARVNARTLWHDGNAMLTWMVGNCAAKIDAKENVYPRKDNERDPMCKIDGVVGLIMTMGLALAGREAPKDYRVVFVG